MPTKISCIVSLHLLLLAQLHAAVQLGHEVGSSSMDSTHYDRRIGHQHCSANNNEGKELNRASFWATVRSLSLPANNTNQSQLIPFRRQLISSNGEDRLVTRAPSSNATNANQTHALGIDQATVDITVDSQVCGLEPTPAWSAQTCSYRSSAT